MSDFSNGLMGGIAGSGGVKGIFQGLALGDTYRQKAEMDSMLKRAKYDLYGAQGAQEALTYNNRLNIDDVIARNPELAQNIQTAMKMFALTGKGDPHNISQASGDFQKQGNIEAVISGALDPTRVGQAHFAVSGKAPFGNSNAHGYSTNLGTGEQIEANPVVAKLYGDLQTGKISHERASAGAQGALAGLRGEQRKAVQQGQLVDGTDENDNPISFRVGTSGKVEIIPGVKPLNKSGNETPAQGKKNAEIDAARNFVSGLSEDEVAALEKKDSFSLTAGDKAKLAQIKLAKTAKYREDGIPTITYKPTAKASPKPGIIDRIFSFPSPQAAPASRGTGAPVQIKSAEDYNALPSGTRYIDPNGQMRVKG